MNHARRRRKKTPLGALAAAAALFAAAAPAQDIRALSQHFNQPGQAIDPWLFIPRENVKEFSTAEHPGLATIYEAGKGRDIKGVLSDPIPIGGYPLPWEFQTALVQSFNATAGVGVTTQANYAIGLNVAVTFSDPSNWPQDRTGRPPRTHEFQLLVAHLGGTGEAGVGLPQYASEPHPETYLVWGRGDMGHTALGDWKVPYIWIGDGAKYGGPASPQLYFRCVVASPTELYVGIKFDAAHGWNMRRIDCSEFGRITGIWEVGPIISGDRWIPDVLCRNLPQVKGPHPLFLGNTQPGSTASAMTPVIAPKPEPPNPRYEYYVDYCVFFGAPPRPFEQYSDDFDIPGFLGQWQMQEQCTLMDTHSHPGYLMLKLLGPGLGTGFGVAGGSELKLSHYKPPWEIEISLIAPDDAVPWNFWMNFILLDKDGKNRGGWTPGIENVPQQKRHKLYNGSTFQLEFPGEIPEPILAHKPLNMLIQCIDPGHVRLGFRAGQEGSWFLSKVFDAKKLLGTDVGSFGMHCWSTASGRMYGAPPGGPMYQTFLIDYIHYRYGLTNRTGTRSRGGMPCFQGFPQDTTVVKRVSHDSQSLETPLFSAIPTCERLPVQVVDRAKKATLSQRLSRWESRTAPKHSAGRRCRRQ
jgi:hypothetical protein